MPWLNVNRGRLCSSGATTSQHLQDKQLGCRGEQAAHSRHQRLRSHPRIIAKFAPRWLACSPVTQPERQHLNLNSVYQHRPAVQVSNFQEDAAGPRWPDCLCTTRPPPARSHIQIKHSFNIIIIIITHTHAHKENLLRVCVSECVQATSQAATTAALGG